MVIILWHVVFFYYMKNENSEKKESINNDILLLAERIRTLRKERGYTNYEFFAYDNDIPRAQYGRYEKGEDLRFSSLMKLIRAFDITPQEFFSKGFENFE